MLYPKEDLKDQKLLMACKNCDYEADSHNALVYVNKLKKDHAMRLDLVDPELAKDPTLPHTKETKCPKCKGKEAVFFMSRAGGKDSDMGLIFLCKNEACLHKWIG